VSRKAIAFLVLLFAAPVLIYLLWPSDESRIRKMFREGAKAAEEKEIDDIMSKVSFNYTDEHGLTYLYLKEGVGRIFKELDSINVEYEIKGIEIRDDNATVEVDLRVIARRGQDAGYVAGDAARPLHMKFFLEKQRTKWLVVKTEGLPAGW
jgi:hypothetical protein